MTDPRNELMLEQFRQPRALLAGHGQKLDEILARLSRLDIGQAGLRREQASDAETVAHLQVQIDRLQSEVDRIHRRLELE